MKAIEKIKFLMTDYQEVYDEMKLLEEQAISIHSAQRRLHDRLNTLRVFEKELLGQIKAELGRDVTMEDLINQERADEL